MNYPKAQKWYNFQQQGAIGIVETMFGSNTEFESGNIFIGQNRNRPQVIPSVVIRNKYNWHTAKTDPTNPWVGLAIFGFIGNPNITARYDYPDFNEAQKDVDTPSTVFGFIYFTALALCIISLIIVSGKFFLFVSHQGLSFSMAQIELALVGLATFFLFFWLLFGRWMSNNYLTFGPTSFFQWHYLPYWYAAVALFAFYLAEVSLITTGSGSSNTLNIFKWPAVFVCAALWVMEVVQGSLFAAYVPGVDIPVVLEVLCAMYMVSSSLLIILVIFSCILLIKATAGSQNQKLIFRLIATSGALVILLIFSNLNFYFIANDNLGRPVQWGEYSPTMAGIAGLWWSTPLASILIALNFSVTVQKEIDISKTGTSSTSMSSGSSGSSGSSSSSSNSDPVIEL
jgi:hypothetical protein